MPHAWPRQSTAGRSRAPRSRLPVTPLRAPQRAKALVKAQALDALVIGANALLPQQLRHVLIPVRGRTLARSRRQPGWPPRHRGPPAEDAAGWSGVDPAACRPGALRARVSLAASQQSGGAVAELSLPRSHPSARECRRPGRPRFCCPSAGTMSGHLWEVWRWPESVRVGRVGLSLFAVAEHHSYGGGRAGRKSPTVVSLTCPRLRVNQL